MRLQVQCQYGKNDRILGGQQGDLKHGRGVSYNTNPQNLKSGDNKKK